MTAKADANARRRESLRKTDADYIGYAQRRMWPFGVLDSVLIFLSVVNLLAAITAALRDDYAQATFRFVGAWFLIWIVEVTSR